MLADAYKTLKTLVDSFLYHHIYTYHCFTGYILKSYEMAFLTHASQKLLEVKINNLSCLLILNNFAFLPNVILFVINFLSSRPPMVETYHYLFIYLLNSL